MAVRMSMRRGGCPSWRTVSVQAQRRKAECLHRIQQSLNVVLAEPDPEIDVAGVAWVPVCGQRIVADNQVLNAVRVE